MRVLTKNLYFFCNIKGTISNTQSNVTKNSVMLKAVWADNVFNEIIRIKTPPTNKTLVDHIREYRLPHDHITKLQKQEFKVTESQIQDSRRQFMQMFDPFSGFQVSQSLTSLQKRISQAANKKNRITFYPNTITSSIIFNAEQQVMNKGIIEKYITLGQPGISKTMSYILSCVLSSMSVSYRYQHSAQAQKLIQQNVLRPKMSKIFYISFKQQQDKFKSYLETILGQCTEISEEIKQFDDLTRKNEIQGLEFQEVILKILYIYKSRKINCLFVMDQVNTLASIFKKYNSLTEEEKNKLQPRQKLKVLNMSQVYNIISDYFPKILNSSSNIQEEILNHSTKENPYTFNINHHTPATKIYIANNPNAPDSKTKAKEIYRFIWYEAAKLIPEGHQKAREIQSNIIKLCDKLAAEYGLRSYVNPLSIFLSMRKFEFKDIFDEGKHKQDKFIKRIFKEILIYAKQLHKNKLKKYFTDHKNTKMKIMIDCNAYLLQNKQSTSVPSSEFKGISNIVLNNYFNKDLFQIKQVEVDKSVLNLIVTRQEFLQLCETMFEQILQMIELKIVIEVFRSRQEILGSFIQSSLVKLTDLIKQFITIKGNNFQIKAFFVDSFIHFLKEESIYKTLEPTFQKLIEKNDQNQGIILLPIKDGKDKKIASGNNPVIDILFVQKRPNNQFRVKSFDLTSNKKKSAIDQKFKKAQEFFKEKLHYSTASNRQKQYYKSISLLKDQIIDFFHKDQKQIKSYQQQYQKITQQETKQLIKKNLEKIIKQSQQNRLQKIQELSKIFPSTDIQQFRTRMSNAEQLQKAVRIAFLKQSLNAGINKELIQSWQHTIVCRKQHLTDKNMVIPLSRIINGTKVTFLLSQMSKLKIQEKDKTQVTTQYKNLIYELLKIL